MTFQLNPSNLTEIRPGGYWTEYHLGVWNAVGTSEANGFQFTVLYKETFP